LSNETKANGNFFISSNVLSAVMYDEPLSLQSSDANKNKELVSDDDSYDEDDDEDEDEDERKFVRVQFGVDLSIVRKAATRITGGHKTKNETDLPVERHLRCVFWDEERAEWSGRGCYMSQRESVMISPSTLNYYQKVCYCDHLTNFALLFDPTAGTARGPHEAKLDDTGDDPYSFTRLFELLLDFLTYAGLATSSLCYIALIVSRVLCLRGVETISNNNNGLCFKWRQYLTASSANNNHRDVCLRHLYLANTCALLATNVLFTLVALIKPHNLISSHSSTATNTSVQHG
jgi:hypothetical protein